MESDQREITWNVFKTAFNEKYFPVSMRNAKEMEFLRLYQECMSITEYTRVVQVLNYLSKEPR